MDFYGKECGFNKIEKVKIRLTFSLFISFGLT